MDSAMQMTRRTTLAALGGATLTPHAAAATTVRQLDHAGLLQSFFDSANPAALAAAVIGREGVLWSGARGVRHEGGSPATTSDLWHLGSNTKAMTAALYARLVETGPARWGATLPELFPDITVDAAHADTTIEHLLSHRAGLLDDTVLGAGWFGSARADPRSLPEQRMAVAARALAAPPTGEKGVMTYGNGNYVIAGAAIERITGLSWEDAMRLEVFQPLGIASAGFGAPRGEQPWGHRSLFGQIQAVAPTEAGADNPAALGPAGTAHMTLEDYGRFLRVFLTDGGGFLRPETVAHLTTAPEGTAYALGWIAYPNRAWARGPVLAHEGSNTLWHVIAIAAPARGVAFVAATNDAARGTAATQGLVQAMIMAGPA